MRALGLAYAHPAAEPRLPEREEGRHHALMLRLPKSRRPRKATHSPAMIALSLLLRQARVDQSEAEARNAEARQQERLQRSSEQMRSFSLRQEVAPPLPAALSRTASGRAEDQRRRSADEQGRKPRNSRSARTGGGHGSSGGRISLVMGPEACSRRRDGAPDHRTDGADAPHRRRGPMRSDSSGWDDLSC